MRRSIALAALGFGLAACSDVPVAPVAPTSVAIAGPSLARGGSAGPIAGQYIVRFRDDEQDVDGEANNQASKHAGKVSRVYKSALKGMAIELTDAEATALRAEPSVLSVEQDQMLSINTTQSGATWGISRLDQRTGPPDSFYAYNADGSGVTVYIIDTGINFTHTEYNGRAFTGIDEVTAGGTAADCNGHGSHVSGTVGGTTYGVAKKVKLIAVRVLDCAGSGSTSGVIAGIDWVTAQKKANPGVPSAANMSLGGGASPTLNTAVENSVAAGVVYAIAAGNDGLNACNYSPASAPNAITVGATDINDGFASFSNRGSCVDINAPGVNITSSWMGSTTATNTISGTSMATPHVAGTIALYLQANPTATTAQVDAALKANASTTTVPSGTTNKLLYSAFITSGPQPLAANFTSSCSGLTCSFDASSTTGASSAATYAWTYGDGSSAAGVKPTAHGYATAGTYSVVLTVTDGGVTSSKTQSVTVSSAPPAPVANFTSSCTRLNCTFTNSSTNATSYSWSFGDGSAASTATNPAHTYPRAGTYTVVLTAKNSGTVSSTKSVTITVRRR